MSETIAEQLRWQRFTLSTALKTASATEKAIIVRHAGKLEKQLWTYEATTLDARQSAQLTILAREVMADNIDAATDLARESPNHPMVSIFLRDAAQHADHAWALRTTTKDRGPFGGLIQLAWVLKQNEQPDITAVKALDAAVKAARDIPPNQELEKWEHPAVERFLIANADIGLAFNIRE